MRAPRGLPEDLIGWCAFSDLNSVHKPGYMRNQRVRESPEMDSFLPVRGNDKVVVIVRTEDAYAPRSSLQDLFQRPQPIPGPLSQPCPPGARVFASSEICSHPVPFHAGQATGRTRRTQEIDLMGAVRHGARGSIRRLSYEQLPGRVWTCR